MLINTEQMISMSEANQNFSKVARMVDQDGGKRSSLKITFPVIW